MTVLDFDYLRKFLRERSGLVLAPDKQYLAESRLLPVARTAGLVGVAELVQTLRRSDSETLAAQVVEAMTTNESFFFRDRIPFEQFRDTIMPELVARRASRRRIRIWCAAASTGQEPYSLAMSLRELGERISDWRIEIVATDISNEVLEKARSGIYSQFEVQRGLPIALLLKYFTKVGDNWQIAPDIRAMVQFRALNLIGDFAHLGLFDVVFCRNVLLYFDQETRVLVWSHICLTRLKSPTNSEFLKAKIEHENRRGKHPVSRALRFSSRPRNASQHYDTFYGGIASPSALGGCKIDDEIELGGLLDRDVAQLRPAQNVPEYRASSAVARPAPRC